METDSAEHQSSLQSTLPNVTSQKKSTILLIFIIIILFIIVLGIGNYMLSARKPQILPHVSKMVAKNPTAMPLFTPVPSVNTQWKSYMDINGKYSFSYPSDWIIQQNTDSRDTAVRFVFYVSNQQYHFMVASGGSGGPIADSIDDEDVIYGGKKFIRRTWSRKGQPFFISVMPQDTDISFNHIEISLPSTNTKKYIEIFDHVLSTLTFTDQIQLINWKTFTYADRSFSLKYPPIWYTVYSPLFSSNPPEFSGHFSFFDVGTDAQYSAGDTGGNEILQVFLSMDDSTIAELQREDSSLKAGSIEEITVDNKPGVKYEDANSVIYDIKPAPNKTMTIRGDGKEVMDNIQGIISSLTFKD